jgi:ABC-type proline/glycine betaine transport system ATPase subunit
VQSAERVAVMAGGRLVQLLTPDQFLAKETEWAN